MQSKEIFLEFYDMNLTFLSILSSFGLILSQYRWHQHQNQEGAKYRQFSFLHFETLNFCHLTVSNIGLCFIKSNFQVDSLVNFSQI